MRTSTLGTIVLTSAVLVAGLLLPSCTRSDRGDRGGKRADVSRADAGRQKTTVQYSDPTGAGDASGSDSFDNFGRDAGSARRWKHGPHWVQDEQLRQVMKEISRYALDSTPGGGEAAGGQSDPAPTDQFFEDAVGLANGLAFTASRIPDAVADRKMSDQDRAGFNAEAANLRRHAASLREAAEAKDAGAMRSRLKEVHATCLACHSRYRDFAGELNDFRAHDLNRALPWLAAWRNANLSRSDTR